MATLTKLTWVIDRDITAIRPLFGVALDTLLETIVSGTYALAHRQVTLMKNQAHVTTPHERNIPYAMIALSLRMYRNGNSAVVTDTSRLFIRAA
jgi:tRNA A37 N6-isopentenylltransferase MiaA